MTEEMHMTVGSLMAKVDRLIDDQDKAAEARKAQYERLEQIERKQDKIADHVAETQKRLIEVETVTSEYKTIKSMGRGYLFGAAIGGGSLVAVTHDYLMAFFKALKGG